MVTDAYNVVKKGVNVTDGMTAKHTGKKGIVLPRDISKHQQQAVTSKERMVWKRGLAIKHLEHGLRVGGHTAQARTIGKSARVG